MLIATMLFLPAAATLPFASAPLLLAQSAQRTVQGKVLDAKDQSVQGAVVFLKNMRSLDIKSMDTSKDGAFNFVQLNPSDDYELWAEYSGHKSSIRTLSAFDTRKNFTVVLRFK
jgi:hypothetical protein